MTTEAATVTRSLCPRGHGRTTLSIPWSGIIYIYTYKVFFSFSKSFRKRYGKRLLCSAGCVLGSVIYLFFFFVLLGHGIAAHKVRDKMISCGLSYYYGNGRTGPISFFRGTPSEICEKPNLRREYKKKNERYADHRLDECRRTTGGLNEKEEEKRNNRITSFCGKQFWTLNVNNSREHAEVNTMSILIARQ